MKFEPRFSGSKCFPSFIVASFHSIFLGVTFPSAQRELVASAFGSFREAQRNHAHVSIQQVSIELLLHFRPDDTEAHKTDEILTR